MSWTDEAITKSIREGRDEGLVILYQSCRDEFRQWASRRYQVDSDVVQDAFQDAIMALRFNISHGKVDGLKSSLKTYLFAIGKNQLVNRLKKQKYEFSAEDLSTLEKVSLIAGEKEALSDRQERIRALVKRMDEPCHSILYMFYYLGYSMEIIATRMEYKSEDVAKTLKSRCIKKIKEVLLN